MAKSKDDTKKTKTDAKKSDTKKSESKKSTAKKKTKAKTKAKSTKTKAASKTASKTKAKTSGTKTSSKAKTSKKTKAKKPPSGKTIRVTQTGSPIGRNDRQRKVLVGLGLNKMNKTRELEDTPAVRGMLKKVSHLVRVEEAA